MKRLNLSRYFPPKDLFASLIEIGIDDALEQVGVSVSGKPIYLYNSGEGDIKLLAWSQMHGNETTTTKALLELVDYLNSTDEGNKLKAKLNLRVIFQLSPDGADAYTRLNANQIDLNRDALSQSQPETKVIMSEFESFQPNFCFNLHGQRTIFAAGDSLKPATLSFLAPSADEDRSLTAPRVIAMKLIAEIANSLEVNDQWGIGRYDDRFNLNCLGDYFTAKGVPTLLFEAGHFPEDYLRLKTRSLLFKSLLTALRSLASSSYLDYTVAQYLSIPNNINTLRDIEIRNVTTVNNSIVTNSTLFVQYRELLKDGEILFLPEYAGNNKEYKGLKVIDCKSQNFDQPIDIEDSAENIINHLKKLINI